MVAISYEPKSPLETEVALVRKGLRSSPDACKTWNIIGIDWFMRWKAYVNLDRDVPEPRSPEVSLLSLFRWQRQVFTFNAHRRSRPFIPDALTTPLCLTLKPFPMNCGGA